MFIKEESVTKLSQQVEELSKKQFQPRMEKLKAIEQDVKIRMEEYALAEERLETGFICPRDLIVLEKPVTFDPCGHTYCKKCVDSIREENFNKLKCPSCLANVDYAFRNMQMEAVCEQFLKRKSMTLSFLEWIKTLKIHLPERD
ncbi:uncharacterized protein BJ171DRAFT_176768 [Polychytrium aggregatum]|uniref:uncharacterized protein n=1 Tax=Polychytrium aggregatum TaxID=110093 RepID=UPI0022FF219E|nr:uncharacterized protein BJ171DRAFT_176768 [Polychytrium aggregatum]KAI9202540.1 hypothetical protein BJ171DRAFT_176768 [Polychytrium aggregatum]